MIEKLKMTETLHFFFLISNCTKICNNSGVYSPQHVVFTILQIYVNSGEIFYVHGKISPLSMFQKIYQLFFVCISFLKSVINISQESVNCIWLVWLMILDLSMFKFLSKHLFTSAIIILVPLFLF